MYIFVTSIFVGLANFDEIQTQEITSEACQNSGVLPSFINTIVQAPLSPYLVSKKSVFFPLTLGGWLEKKKGNI